MLRQIVPEGNLSGDGNLERWLIKRRLIPLEIVVSGQGDYLTFRQKLPYNTKKLVGIIATSDTPPPEISTKYKIVWGVGAPRSGNEYYMRVFTIHTVYDTELSLGGYQAREGEYAYYGQPKSMDIPSLKLNGDLDGFDPPVVIDKVSHIDLGEDFFLWKSKEHSLGEISIEILQKGDDDEDI